MFDCGDGSTLHNVFLFRADEIYRCDALQSPSVHHRIDWREWPCSGGLSPSRITHEPQHDWSLLTTPESVPYSQSQHIVPPLPEKKLETLFFFSPISLEDKTKKRTIYNNEPPWFSIWSLANHISVDSWSHSLTHSLERLDSCVLPTLGCWVSAVTCLPTEWIMWPSASHGWSCTVSR